MTWFSKWQDEGRTQVGVKKWADWLKTARIGGATEADLSALCNEIEAGTGLISPPFRLFARWTDDKHVVDEAEREAKAEAKRRVDERTRKNAVEARKRIYESLKPRYDGEITDDMGTDRWLMSRAFARWCEMVEGC